MKALQESGFIIATLFIALIALLLVLAARRDARTIRENAQEEAERVRNDSQSLKAELSKREAVLDQREDALDARQADLTEREANVRFSEERLSNEHARVESSLQRIARLTEDEARDELFASLERQNQELIDKAVISTQARIARESDAAAQRVLVDALTRLSVPTSSEFAIDVFELDSEDLKGRIIGKEGRNIRTFEAVAGVNLIIEDDSSSVKISSFDAERRDVARTALSELLKHGLVTPARIENEVAKARDTLSVRSRTAGYAALDTVGVSGIAPDLINSLGRLRFRMSYTQNVLEHSVETAQIAGLLAEELGLDAELARRAALFHDIGKVLTPATKGSHAALGAKMLQEFGESDAVVNAVASHHGGVDPMTLEAVLVQIADSVSASRPGARKDDATNYAERMQHIEKVLSGFPGVRQAFALGAGHQIRVAVESDLVTDAELAVFTKRLAEHLQQEVIVPGEMEITVVREHVQRVIVG